MARIWDSFLTDADRAHTAALPREPLGFGENAALILIDNYRDVLGDRPEPLLTAIKTWPMSMGPAAWAALPRIQQLLNASRENGIPVVHVTALTTEESGVALGASMKSVMRRRKAKSRPLTQEEADRRARQFDFPEELAPIDGEAIIKKMAPSAFFGTPLASHLNLLGVDTVIVTGEATSGCVRATVVDAASYRFRVIVPEDCVYDRHEASHAINLFDMNQKYADVLPDSDVLDWITR